MSLDNVILESWDRQAEIITNLISLVTEDIRKVKPSEDGWPLDFQLAHIHEVRYEWLNSISKEHAATLGDVYVQVEGKWRPIDDLEEIRRQIGLSAKAVRDGVAALLAAGAQKVGGYDHPLFFLQHMIWHEGWHAGLIMLALRNAGREPTNEWEEKNIWGYWRVE